MLAKATPRARPKGAPLRSTMNVSTVPTMSAVPIATGNATARPAIAIAATSSKFARLNTTPAAAACQSEDGLAVSTEVGSSNAQANKTVPSADPAA